MPPYLRRNGHLIYQPPLGYMMPRNPPSVAPLWPVAPGAELLDRLRALGDEQRFDARLERRADDICMPGSCRGVRRWW